MLVLWGFGAYNHLEANIEPQAVRQWLLWEVKVNRCMYQPIKQSNIERFLMNKIIVGMSEFKASRKLNDSQEHLPKLALSEPCKTMIVVRTLPTHP